MDKWNMPGISLMAWLLKDATKARYTLDVSTTVDLTTWNTILSSYTSKPSKWNNGPRRNEC